MGGHCRLHDVEATDNDVLRCQSDLTARSSLWIIVIDMQPRAPWCIKHYECCPHTFLPPLSLTSIRLVFRDEAWMFSFARVPAANLTTENLFESLHLGISPRWRRWRNSSTRSAPLDEPPFANISGSVSELWLLVGKRLPRILHNPLVNN